MFCFCSGLMFVFSCFVCSVFFVCSFFVVFFPCILWCYFPFFDFASVSSLYQRCKLQKRQCVLEHVPGCQSRIEVLTIPCVILSWKWLQDIVFCKFFCCVLSTCNKKQLLSCALFCSARYRRTTSPHCDIYEVHKTSSTQGLRLQFHPMRCHSVAVSCCVFPTVFFHSCSSPNFGVSGYANFWNTILET